LTIEKGEVVCLIGPNGAGKTTLIRMLLGFLQPSGGSMTLFDRSHVDPSTRNFLGYFPEKAKYPSTLRVGQFLGYWGSFSGLSGYQLSSRVDEVLSLVKLEQKRNALIKTLSKGMAVRLGLAQALINDPQLLILDEPSDGLDPLGRIELRRLTCALRDRGTTILMNSHLLSEVEKVSDRVAIMDRGKILRIERSGFLLSLGQQTTITFSLSDGGKLPELKSTFRPTENANHYEVTINDGSELDEVIKQLSDIHASIINVSKREDSLESLFLSLIKSRR
jgi:ABC-2 type transport system ATP-binding protein